MFFLSFFGCYRKKEKQHLKTVFETNESLSPLHDKVQSLIYTCLRESGENGEYKMNFLHLKKEIDEKIKISKKSDEKMQLSGMLAGMYRFCAVRAGIEMSKSKCFRNAFAHYINVIQKVGSKNLKPRRGTGDRYLAPGVHQIDNSLVFENMEKALDKLEYKDVRKYFVIAAVIEMSEMYNSSDEAALGFSELPEEYKDTLKDKLEAIKKFYLENLHVVCPISWVQLFAKEVQGGYKSIFKVLDIAIDAKKIVDQSTPIEIFKYPPKYRSNRNIIELLSQEDVNELLEQSNKLGKLNHRREPGRK